MALLLLATLFAACTIYVNGQSTCSTPSGAKGTCISIYQCNPLLDLIRKSRTPQIEDYLKRSQCGFIGTSPAVCCPDPCFNVEGNPGQCISIHSCPHLKNMLVPPVPRKNIDYVRNSRCQGPEELSVCCAPSLYNRVSPKVEKSCERIVAAYPPDPLSKCCGKESGFGNKIFDGEEATADQYPWLALLEYDTQGTINTYCGGSLISAKYVLTAAHCVTGYILTYSRPVNIRLGEHNTSHTNPDCIPVAGGGVECNENLVVIPIAEIIPHRDFRNARKRGNDIALVRMQRMAPYTDFIRPICLPTMDVTLSPPDDFNLFIAGWGATSIAQSSSQVKMFAKVPLVSSAACSSFYKSGESLSSKQICAGGVDGKDSCQGDSGGPLMYENRQIHEIIGITSFGPSPCGQQNISGLYTKVYEYRDWIISNIRP